MNSDLLLLLSGNDIPYAPAQLIVHNPKIKEIAYIGEEEFFTGVQILQISKNVLTNEDKFNLEDINNFDILIAILGERNAVMQKNKDCVNKVLALLFPEYDFSFNSKEIIFEKDNEKYVLNRDNFDGFQKLLKSLFSFGNEEDVPQDFNPVGEMASKIAEKLKKRHQTLAEQKQQDGAQDIIGRYVSVVATSLYQDINNILNYTLYQLFDQIKRIQLRDGYDIYIKAKMAGAADLTEPDDWMKSLYVKNNTKN